MATPPLNPGGVCSAVARQVGFRGCLMKSAAIRIFLVVAIFTAFYSLWGSLATPNAISLEAAALPILLGRHQFLLLIPVEGLLFSVASLIALWPMIRGERAFLLSVIGVLANCVTYFLAFFSVWFGFWILETVIILSAIGFFLLIGVLASAPSPKIVHIFAISAVVAPSIIIHGSPLLPGFTLFLSKGLWWLAVLGAAVLLTRQEGPNKSFKADASGAA